MPVVETLAKATVFLWGAFLR